MTQDALNLILALGQSCLAIIATFIAVNQRREQKYDMRVENLRKIIKSIRVERYYYARQSLKYYQERFKDDPEVRVDQVIYRKGWVQDKDDPYFIPLDQISLNLRDGSQPDWQTADNPQPDFLPTPRDGYAENAKFHCDINLMNLPLYGLGGVRLTGVGGDKRLALDIIKGHYYDFYDTCEVLSAEMADHRRIRREPDLMKARLPLRDKTSDLFDLTNRFAGIGVNALTIIHNVRDGKGKKGSYFLLHKRSGNVAEGIGNYHVVPAGSYQPATVEFPERVEEIDRNLNFTVVRELGEELLGEEEFSDLFSSELVTAYRKIPAAELIGIGFDPLNTKTEIMACLTLDAETTNLFGGKTTAEEIQDQLTSTYEGQVSLKELTRPMIRQFRDNPMSIPAFRQILTVVLEHGQRFGVR